MKFRKEPVHRRAQNARVRSNGPSYAMPDGRVVDFLAAGDPMEGVRAGYASSPTPSKRKVKQQSGKSLRKRYGAQRTEYLPGQTPRTRRAPKPTKTKLQSASSALTPPSAPESSIDQRDES